MADRIGEIVIELAGEVRNGGDLEKLIPEFAEEYELRPDVLRFRFAKAYPDGVGKPLPSAEEMERRRRENEVKEMAQNEIETRAILEYFARNPGWLFRK